MTIVYILNQMIQLHDANPDDFVNLHMTSRETVLALSPLIFLQADRPHFKYWDEQDKEHLVKEKSGAMFNMRLGTPHAVTEISKNESPKYSICIMQGLDMQQRKVA